MMRNAVVVLGLLAGSAAPAPAQTSWADKMFHGAASHDFGSIPHGAQLFHRFKITNIYAVRLEIVQTRSSCGCVTLTPSTRALEPREEGYLDVLMDARKFKGRKAVHIYLTVGPQFVSTATLQVSANSRTDVVFNPGQVNFGIVPAGQTPQQAVEVEYAGTLDWRVSEVVKGSAPLNATLQELYRRPGQVGYRVTVTLKADTAPGAFKQELFLKTNDPDSPLVPVLVEATIQAPLAVVPSQVALGSVKAGELVTRKVVIRGSRPFRITAIDGLGNGVTAELPQAPAVVHVLTLAIRPTKTGELERELRIKTDLGPESAPTVTVKGTVEP